MLTRILIFLSVLSLASCSEKAKEEASKDVSKKKDTQVQDTTSVSSDSLEMVDDIPETVSLTHFYDQDGFLNVLVDNVDSLFVHLQSNTVITLESGTYYLDDIDSTLFNKHVNQALVLFDEIYYDEDVWDDQTLLITGVENLTIKSADDLGVEILTRKLSASVLAFDSCKNIELNDLSLGHENETLQNKEDPWVSYCSGEVLEFFDCKNVNMYNMDLFGCGTRGFLAHRCESVSLIDSEIHDCTYGTFGVFGCDEVLISHCLFKDNTFRSFIEIEESGDVILEYTAIINNTEADQYTDGVVVIDESSKLVTSDLEFSDNDFGSNDVEGYP